MIRVWDEILCSHLQPENAIVHSRLIKVHDESVRSVGLTTYKV